VEFASFMVVILRWNPFCVASGFGTFQNVRVIRGSIFFAFLLGVLLKQLVLVRHG
jgi:hypothetical protein